MKWHKRYTEKAQGEQPVKIPAICYTKITELPLSKFIECAVDQNYSALIKSGRPTDNDLLDAWLDINSQYSDAMGDSEDKLYLSLFKQIHQLQLTIVEVTEIVKVLHEVYVPQFHFRLNTILNTSFKLDVRLADDYDNDLRRAIALTKGYKLTLDMKLGQFEAIKANREGTEQVSREYFISVLAVLSNHVKFQITELITVFEFAYRVKELNKYIHASSRGNK